MFRVGGLGPTSSFNGFVFRILALKGVRRGIIDLGLLGLFSTSDIKVMPLNTNPGL